MSSQRSFSARARWHQAAAVAGLAILAVGGSPAEGTGVPMSPLTKVSDGSPFAGKGCFGDPAFAESEYDQMAASDPSTPGRLLAVWYQDDGAGIVAARTDDGGASWTAEPLAGFTACSGNSGFLGTFDPWVSIGGDGRAYVVASAWGDKSPIDYAAVVTTSSDGGRSWSPATPLTTGEVVDHTVVLADTDVAGRAWIAWNGAGTIWISRTDDGGGSWTAPQLLAAPIPGTLGAAPQLALTDGGDLVLLYSEIVLQPGLFFPVPRAETPTTLKTLVSSDGGATWSPPTVAHIAPANVVRDPEDGSDGWPVTFTSMAGDGDAVVAVWNEVRSPTDSSLMEARSPDGLTWEVNRLADFDHQVFAPTVAVTEGRLGVSFYAFRDEASGDGRSDVVPRLLTRAGGNVALADLGPAFNQHAVASGGGSGGRFGDYFGLAGWSSRFTATFVLGSPTAVNGPLDVFARTATSA